MVSNGGEKAPASDGQGANFFDREHQVRLGMRATRAELTARASLLASRPRRVRLAEGGDILDRGDGASKILNILRNYFAPDAADAVRRQVVRFVRFRRTDQPIDEYAVDFGLFRRKAEPAMETGAGAPDQFISISRMDHPALSLRGKSLLMKIYY